MAKDLQRVLADVERLGFNYVFPPCNTRCDRSECDRCYPEEVEYRDDCIYRVNIDNVYCTRCETTFLRSDMQNPNCCECGCTWPRDDEDYDRFVFDLEEEEKQRDEEEYRKRVQNEDEEILANTVPYIDYVLRVYACGTTECSTCGVVGCTDFAPPGFVHYTPNERIQAFYDYKNAKGMSSVPTDEVFQGKLAFNDGTGIGNYYCVNCGDLGEHIVVYPTCSYDEFYSYTSSEEEKQDIHYPVTIHPGGVIACETCGPIGRYTYEPTDYIEGFTEGEVWTLDQDGNRIEFQYDPENTANSPEWLPIVPLSYGQNQLGWYCKKCGAEPHVRECEEDDVVPQEAPIDRAEYLAEYVEAKLDVVCKPRVKRSKSEPSSPNTTAATTNSRVRSYSEEMCVNMQQTIAVKFLSNYSREFLYPAEDDNVSILTVDDEDYSSMDDEELLARKRVSKKLRSRDIHRERVYKIAGIVDNFPRGLEM